MRTRTPHRELPRLVAILVVGLGALGAGATAVSAAADPSYCAAGKPASQPCQGCPGDPQGPCSPYEDRGRVDIGQSCCDPACVDFKGNPYGQYEDYVWVYGWSYHNRVSGANYRQSYVGGKGGTVGPWTPKGRFHQPVCD